MDSYQFNLIAVKEVANTYKIPLNTLYSLIKQDPTFPCVNIGPKKNYRIDSSRLPTWIKERFKARRPYELDVLSGEQLYRIGRN